MDVTAVTTYLSGTVAPAIGTVAAAALMVLLAVRGWKYIHRAI